MRSKYVLFVVGVLLPACEPGVVSSFDFVAGELEMSPVTGYAGSVVYKPKGAGPLPGIVMMHGSEGGAKIMTHGREEGAFSLNSIDAQDLAKAGFAVMVYCWFDCTGLPAQVQDVSLNRAVDAITWFKNSPHIGGRSVGLFGWSRGGEKAVLLGSLLKSRALVSAVAAHAPSDTVVVAYDPKSPSAVKFNEAAWVWNNARLFGERSLPWGSGPRIEIENYPGPVWLSHGQKDEVWSFQRTVNIEATRKNLVPQLETEVNLWPTEGHMIGDNENYSKFIGSLAQFFARHLR